jgi:hypothetical protein
MFIVILAVVALTDYIITFYCIVNLAAKPADETIETTEDISEEFFDHIEEQNARISHLSFKVDEILSNIDSIIGENKVKQGVSL